MATSDDALSSGRITARVAPDERDAPASLVGSLLQEKYLVESVVGQGSMGIVLRARHLQLRETVAIKLLRPELTRDPRAIARFLREARALARMRSPHVARVMDVGTPVDASPFLVMELLEGRDLAAELAERGALPASEALAIALQICDAMQEAHELGVVHRDLKPANVFLARGADGRCTVKVIDFGIARGRILADDGESDLTAASCVLGSPAYMAPEQVRAADSADARSDIWSLGVILYEMMAGSLPFGSGRTTAVLASICGDDFVPLDRAASDVSAPIASVVARCLAKRPADRFGSMKELQSALTRAASGEMPRAAAPRRPRLGSRWLLAPVLGVTLWIAFATSWERTTPRFLPERSRAQAARTSVVQPTASAERDAGRASDTASRTATRTQKAPRTTPRSATPIPEDRALRAAIAERK